MFDYDKYAKAAVSQLDKYDLLEVLRWCDDADLRDAWDIKQKVGEEYPELDNALDDLTVDEFMEYLCVKYHVRFEEVISYRMWYVPQS